jgi:hypothetical protein
MNIRKFMHKQFKDFSEYNEILNNLASLMIRVADTHWYFILNNPKNATIVMCRGTRDAYQKLKELPRVRYDFTPNRK